MAADNYMNYVQPMMMGGNPMIQQQPPVGYFNNPYATENMGYNNYAVQQMPWNGMFVNSGNRTVPHLVNILTDEQIKQLTNNPGKNIFDMNITEDDLYRAYCYHNSNNRPVIVSTKDGECYCPICQAKFRDTAYTKEELDAGIKIVLDALQQCKLSGQVPVAFGKEIFSIIPIIGKIPELYNFTNKTMEKMFSNNMYGTAQELSNNALYNNLNAGRMRLMMPSPYMNQYNGAMYPNNGYYPQSFTNPNPQQVVNPQMGATMVNPMQVPYGFNPQAQNQQFVGQAQMMMNNPYQPVAPATQTQPQQQTTQAPAAAQQATQPTADANTTTTKSGQITL